MGPPRHVESSPLAVDSTSETFDEARDVLGVVVASGYEQRLSMWLLCADKKDDEPQLQTQEFYDGREKLWLPQLMKRNIAASTPGEATPQLSLLAETFVEVADIGGIGLAKNGNIYSAAVVGEGMHIVHMNTLR